MRLPLSTPTQNASFWGLASRQEAAEWLDQGAGTPRDVAVNLAEMWRINRDLGGYRALERHLCPRLLEAGREHRVLTVADLGTGSAEVPRTLARWARQRGLRLRVLAVDVAARHLAVARVRLAGAPGVSLLQADAARLPLPEGGVDFVISSLFLHHFAPEALALLLRAAFDHARRAVIMCDLVRGPLPYLAFKLAQPVYARHPLTRHDGAASILRAYTPRELSALAARAGLTTARVHTHWPWRMTLVADQARPGGEGRA